MIKLSLAVLNLALDDLFNEKIDKYTQEPQHHDAILFFCSSDSEYMNWLNCLGIKEWQHPFFMLTKFQLRHKKIREALD